MKKLLQPIFTVVKHLGRPDSLSCCPSAQMRDLSLSCKETGENNDFDLCNFSPGAHHQTHHQTNF